MDGARSSFEKALEEARRGSKEALGKLLEAHRRHLSLTAAREVDSTVGLKSSPSDIVQETLLRAGRDFKTFQGGTEAALAGWLAAILDHQIKNTLQRYHGTAKRALTREWRLDGGGSAAHLHGRLVVDTPTPGARAVSSEETVRLLAAISRLSTEQQEAIRMRDFESKSWEDIGRVMGKAPGAARALWYRAMRRLRDELAPHE